MNGSMESALRIIIARSPNATGEAIATLAAIRAKSPVLQLRYNHAAELAFNDPGATFTPEERAEIAANLGSGVDEIRDYTLRIRLTDAERIDLTRMAEAAGMSMSEYVRARVFAQGE